MNRGMALLTVFAAIAAVSLSACSQSTVPTGPATQVEVSSITPRDLGSQSAGNLSALQFPELNATHVSDGVRLVFSAGASGMSDDPSIVAARSIELVDFELFDAGGRLIGRNATTEVPTTGVINGETRIASLTVFAESDVAPTAPVLPGSYAVARIHGQGDDILVVTAALPTSPQ